MKSNKDRPLTIESTPEACGADRMPDTASPPYGACSLEARAVLPAPEGQVSLAPAARQGRCRWTISSEGEEHPARRRAYRRECRAWASAHGCSGQDLNTEFAASRLRRLAASAILKRSISDSRTPMRRSSSSTDKSPSSSPITISGLRAFVPLRRPWLSSFRPGIVAASRRPWTAANS